MVGDEPTPEMALLIAEEYERLLAGLEGENLRAIARSKLAGYSNNEIASQLACSVRTVERRLQMIRIIWSRQTP